ncbi:TPA: hypothetical protein TUU90_001468, partial [Streptococcus equi subsp. zooepidemicus]|nr:hypothetical protein [Streptococcus equi subsp. zooepidemicus]
TDKLIWFPAKNPAKKSLAGFLFGFIISVMGKSTMEIIGLFSVYPKTPYDLSQTIIKKGSYERP